MRKSVASVVASASVTVNEQEDAWYTQRHKQTAVSLSDTRFLSLFYRFKANEVRLDHLHCDLKLLHKVMRTAVTDLERRLKLRNSTLLSSV